jgi:hypothetical protein
MLDVPRTPSRGNPLRRGTLVTEGMTRETAVPEECRRIAPGASGAHPVRSAGSMAWSSQTGIREFP